MKKFYAALFIITILGIVLATALVYSPVQEAHVLMRDQNFEASRTVLEKQYSGGASKPEVVLPLIRASAAVGDWDRATELIGKLNPEEAGIDEFRSMQKALYRSAFDFDKLDTLLAEETPRPETLHERLELAQASHNLEKEQQLLTHVLLTESAPASAFKRLALLKASAKEYTEALAILESFNRKFPAVIDRSLQTLELFMRAQKYRSGDSSQSVIIKTRIREITHSRREPLGNGLWQLIDLGIPEIAKEIFFEADTQQAVDQELIDPGSKASLELQLEQDLFARLLKIYTAKRLSSDQEKLFFSLALKSKANIQTVLDLHLHGRPVIPRSALQNIGFTLLNELKEVDMAELVFKDLAKDESPRDQNLKMLLHIWGPRPSPDSVQWLVRRAQRAPKTQVLDWLKAIDNAGGEQEVITLVEANNWNLDTQIRPLFHAILLRSKNFAVLKKSLNRLLQEPTLSSSSLAELGSEARAASLYEEELQFLRARIRQYPEDKESRLRLGILAFEKTLFAEANEALKPLLGRGKIGDLVRLGSSTITMSEIVKATYYGGLLAQRSGTTLDAKRLFVAAIEICEKNQKGCQGDPLYSDLLLQSRGRSQAIDFLQTKAKHKALSEAESVRLAQLLMQEGNIGAATKIVAPEKFNEARK